MTRKRLTILTLVFAMMATMAGAVISAQDDSIMGKRGDRGGFGGYSDLALEATGLTAEELRTALQDGATIADLITANDGDVDSVIAELVAESTTQINERVEAGRMTQEQADVILANLEDNITERLNGTFERLESVGGRGGFGELDTIILDATGLTAEELRTALADGSTIAELIEANGGDVDSVVEQLADEQATRLTERLNGTFERLERPEGFGGGRGGRGGRGGKGGEHGFGFGFGSDVPTDTSDDT